MSAAVHTPSCILLAHTPWGDSARSNSDKLKRRTIGDTCKVNRNTELEFQDKGRETTE